MTDERGSYQEAVGALIRNDWVDKWEHTEECPKWPDNENAESSACTCDAADEDEY